MSASEYVKKSMDDSVDPCNDFYTFACGGFNTKAVIADDKNSFTTFDVVKEGMEEQVRKNTNTKSGHLISSHVLTSKESETVRGENSGGGSKAVQDAQDILHLLHGH